MSKKSIKILFLIIISLFLLTTVKQTRAIYSSSADREIDNLNLKIRNQKKQINNLKSKQTELQKVIRKKRLDQITLKNQLSLIGDNVDQAQLEIDSTNLEIDKTNLEIKKVQIDNDKIDQKITEQKQHIADLLRLVYKNNQISTLEALLLNNSLAGFLNQAQYLEDANKEISRGVDTLKQAKEALGQNKITLQEKQKELETLKNKLSEKKNSLLYEQQNKKYILVQTHSSERRYQLLLSQAKKDQAQAEAEIASAERLIRQKMSEKDRNLLNRGSTVMAWPVPKNYITTYFHDPNYPYRKILGEHPAIDIRAAYGTTLRAAADGYVAKVRFNKNSNRYAYIMLIHGNGLATVYGHVSAVYVTAGQYVSRGQIIGKTGGTPGTAGAGRFTTGPHLHFEVRKNGLPVNPLNYLP